MNFIPRSIRTSRAESVIPRANGPKAIGRSFASAVAALVENSPILVGQFGSLLSRLPEPLI